MTHHNLFLFFFNNIFLIDILNQEKKYSNLKYGIKI